jgi:hypothetical protein
MLILFGGHKKSCKHKKKGRSHRTCQCPIWIDGTLGGKRVRKSLNMRDWKSANETMIRWEADGKISDDSRKTIEGAWADFLITADSRKLSAETVRKAQNARLLDDLMEARVGIEPTYKGFADLSLTTWVPRLGHTV